MINAPGRESPRFPAGREPFAPAAIAAALVDLDAGRGDLAICGGNPLFAEVALARGATTENALYRTNVKPSDPMPWLQSGTAAAIVSGMQPSQHRLIVQLAGGDL
jgi:hypothetical protein